jgi:hypothetical protein
MSREKAKQILLRLTLEERKLLTRVLKIERATIHQVKPRNQEELMKAIKEEIK